MHRHVTCNPLTLLRLLSHENKLPETNDHLSKPLPLSHAALNSGKPLSSLNVT